MRSLIIDLICGRLASWTAGSIGSIGTAGRLASGTAGSIGSQSVVSIGDGVILLTACASHDLLVEIFMFRKFYCDRMLLFTYVQDII